MIKICSKKDCSGCYACYSICPNKCLSMSQDDEGFWYPEIDKPNCSDCKHCEEICPILKKTIVDNTPVAYACVNRNLAARLGSSSGGVFTLIAEETINKGGVVFGAGFDEDFNVLHAEATTISQISSFRGSKYVQSKIGETYKKAGTYLREGRKVLFSGTPCQIGGLKAYLRKDYGSLFCVDIICHGVPSPKVWEEYIAYRENFAGSSAYSVTFRQKSTGWRRYGISFRFKNKTEYLKTNDKDLYMQAFLRNVCLRPSCYACAFKTIHRQSDITLGDFWGVENVVPELDDDKGVSLVLVNSKKGENLFNIISDKMMTREVDLNKAITLNYPAIRSVPLNPNREKFFTELSSLRFDKLVGKYCSDSISLRCKKLVWMILYTLKHKVYDCIRGK